MPARSPLDLAGLPRRSGRLSSEAIDVHQLEADVAQLIARRYPSYVRVRGEVTECTRVGQGEKHLRFRLASEDCEIQCILFEDKKQRIDRDLKDKRFRTSADALIDPGNCIVVGGRLKYEPGFG